MLTGCKNKILTVDNCGCPVHLSAFLKLLLDEGSQHGICCNKHTCALYLNRFANNSNDWVTQYKCFPSETLLMNAVFNNKLLNIMYLSNSNCIHLYINI